MADFPAAVDVADGVPARPLAWLKAHGTKNDFVVVLDPDGTRYPDLGAAGVRALCDRRAGIGGDGLIRVTRTPGAGHWFMDYRNADGSIAEMCGNGARVFIAVLLREGLVAVGDGGVDFVTRAGDHHASWPAATVRHRDAAGRAVAFADIEVTMGRAQTPGDGAATVVHHAGRTYSCEAVFMPNPHAVIAVDGPALDALDLTVEPIAEPLSVYPAKANIEFAQTLAPGHVRMRVFERGVGETQACGTGACAVAWVHLQGVGRALDTVRVDMPGGPVWVRREAAGGLTLRGAAMIVAEGTTTWPAVGMAGSDAE